MKGEPHQKYLSDFSPCNTGNPNQNYQVCTLHTNYRHEIRMTLLLVAGVISAPPTPCLILIPCLLTLQSVMAGFLCLYIKIHLERTDFSVSCQ